MAFPTPTILPADANRANVFVKAFDFDNPQAGYVVPLGAGGDGGGISGIQSGEVTLVAGVATIALPSVNASSIILLSRRTVGGTAGNMGFTRNSGVGFSITNSSATDTSIVNWVHIPVLGA
jgi:hypothetical protein